MNSKTALTILAIAAVIILGFIVLRGPAEAPVDEGAILDGETAEEGMPVPGEEDVSEMVAEEENVIVYTDSGYSPSQITISSGETVTWRNESSADMWTASAVHPTHAVYPGSGISICGTAEAINIFDSCERISSGAEWSFTFDETGTWGYHNHVQASHTGRVIVE